MVRIATGRKSGYKKSEASREQVLDAAIRVLAKQGIANTSVQDIADAAGLSKGAVHYHFESKEELLERVLDRCCEAVEARIRAVFAQEGLPLERIHRALAEMWAVRRDGVREMRVLSELHSLSRQNKRIKKACGEALQRACRQMIDTGLEHLVAMGLRPKVPVEVIPRLIIATLDGLSLQQEIDPVSPETEAVMMRALEATTMSLFEL
ncbi:MAG: TetR/AcrR family transcriptional regulator [Labilithrix sp.]|nr:TetR/AcrR family transcriptional regulator [Labilithrix sp.]